MRRGCHRVLSARGTRLGGCRTYFRVLRNQEATWARIVRFGCYALRPSCHLISCRMWCALSKLYQMPCVRQLQQNGATELPAGVVRKEGDPGAVLSDKKRSRVGGIQRRVQSATRLKSTTLQWTVNRGTRNHLICFFPSHSLTFRS